MTYYANTARTPASVAASYPDTPEGHHAAAAAGVNTLAPDPTNGGRHIVWSDGTPITEADLPNIRQFGIYTANEDARRFGIGQGNIEASRQQAAQQHADDVKQAKALLKQRQYEFSQNYGLDTQRINNQVSQFNTNTGVDLLKNEAQNRGALNFVQGDMLAQGATQLSPWLQSFRTGGAVQYGGGTATGMNPTPLTNQTLANQYAGGGGGPAGQVIAQAGQGPSPAAQTDQYGRPLLSPGVQAVVDGVSKVTTGGIANQPQGWWENQTKGKQQGYMSASDYLGRNTDEDLQYYARSRPGQGQALSA